MTIVAPIKAITSMIFRVLGLEAALYTVRLCSGFGRECTMLGNMLMPKSAIKKTMAAAEERKAMKSLFSEISRGILATAMTLRIGTAKNTGYWRIVSAIFGT